MWLDSTLLCISWLHCQGSIAWQNRKNPRRPLGDSLTADPQSHMHHYLIAGREVTDCRLTRRVVKIPGPRCHCNRSPTPMTTFFSYIQPRDSLPQTVNVHHLTHIIFLHNHSLSSTFNCSAPPYPAHESKPIPSEPSFHQIHHLGVTPNLGGNGIH